MCLLLNRTGDRDLVTRDMEKVEQLHASFALVSTGKTSL